MQRHPTSQPWFRSDQQYVHFSGIFLLQKDTLNLLGDEFDMGRQAWQTTQALVRRYCYRDPVRIEHPPRNFADTDMHYAVLRKPSPLPISSLISCRLSPHKSPFHESSRYIYHQGQHETKFVPNVTTRVSYQLSNKASIPSCVHSKNS